MDFLPVGLSNIISPGKLVACEHGLRSVSAMILKLSGRRTVDFCCEGRNRFSEIRARALVAFAMHHPPFKLQARGAIGVKRSIADAPDRVVVVQKIGQGAFVIRPVGAIFENECCFRSVKGHYVRSQRRQSVLPAQKRSKLIEKPKPLPAVVGLPHVRFHPGHIPGIKLAEAGLTRSPQVGRQSNTYKNRRSKESASVFRHERVDPQM